jgi:hypothetical protein
MAADPADPRFVRFTHRRPEARLLQRVKRVRNSRESVLRRRALYWSVLVRSFNLRKARLRAKQAK